ncbi:etfdh [Symbiodinium sp. KB8]|nr:etfdh [Symbiodinium sp. KB8]
MHILSGNVFETRALDELIPDWKDKGIETEAVEDKVMYLTKGALDCQSAPALAAPHAPHLPPPRTDRGISLPIIPLQQNHGNYIISLSQLTSWLGEQATELGVDIFPATAASEVLYGDDGSVRGVATRDMGIAKDGTPKDNFTRGIEITGKQTLISEGVRGSCAEDIMAKLGLREGVDPQTYGLGLKEVWEVDPEKNPHFKPGYIQHSIGWPSPSDVYAGSFLYHMAPNYVLVGYVVGLDYQNPYLNPYKEFQTWKHHPEVSKHLEGGRCIQYGARCINEGGAQAIPKITFPGGALLGCSAGFLNVPKIKGSHLAMKTGALAGEAVFELFEEAEKKREELGEGVEAVGYDTAVKSSWAWEEMHAVRNYHPSFKWGQLAGVLYSGISAYLLGGREPWTFRNSKPDSAKTRPAAASEAIEYPKPDGKLSFDILENLQRSGTNHEEQPAHLRVKPELAHVPGKVSYKTYGVYEYADETDSEGNGQLIINAQNCVHCKCCSIKMPQEYIDWTVPEGGGGPAYSHM